MTKMTTISWSPTADGRFGKIEGVRWRKSLIRAADSLQLHKGLAFHVSKSAKGSSDRHEPPKAHLTATLTSLFPMPCPRAHGATCTTKRLRSRASGPVRSCFTLDISRTAALLRRGTELATPQHTATDNRNFSFSTCTIRASGLECGPFEILKDNI